MGSGEKAHQFHQDAELSTYIETCSKGSSAEWMNRLGIYQDNKPGRQPKFDSAPILKEIYKDVQRASC